MWRRFSWLVPVVVVFACQGLNLDNGNAYPCDFSAPMAERDAVCLEGDVCGTNNLCQKYIYEGPRFEGTPNLPDAGPGSHEGEVLHPLVLKNAAETVLADLPLGRSGVAYVKDSTGTIHVVRSGHVAANTLTLPTVLPPGFREVKSVQPFFGDAVQAIPDVLIQDDQGQLAVAGLNALRAFPVQVGNTTVAVTGAKYRVLEQAPDGGLGERIPRALPVAWNLAGLGVVEKQGLVPGPWTFTPWLLSPGEVFDIAGLTQPYRMWVLMLHDDQIAILDRADGGVDVAAEMVPMTTTSGTLHTDVGNRIIAATRRGPTMGPLPVDFDVLSTFQVNIDPSGPVLTSPWPDCTPCPADQRIEILAPSVRTGAPSVELVCVGSGFPEAVRVIGSVALTQTDACITEQLALPLTFGRVATVVGPPARLVQWPTQSGLLVGGRDGELWFGETLSTLRPSFLDRVPRDVTPVVTGQTTSLATITDDYLAVQQSADTQGPGERLNGFRHVSTRELGVGDDARLLGFVHGVNGWAVANGGEVVRVRVTPLGAKVEPGPILITANGDPIRDSIGGESYTAADGVPVGFFLAADDSLYFLPDPESSLTPTDQQEELAPDLTPEPSVPIRSLALERTPLGTDGEKRARGYLVTSRNVYSWQLGGSPARWSATPLVLAGGEPREVWFDRPLSALARVGYSDGQIFTLPGGYELAQPLPPDDDGVPAQVLDYENLGGWPVAYATSGIFWAGWDVVNGKLQNRYDDGRGNRPMTWREIKLPDGNTPWIRPLRREAVPGRLYVVVDPKIPEGQPNAGLTPHRLLLFLDNKVIQLATHLRK